MPLNRDATNTLTDLSSGSTWLWTPQTFQAYQLQDTLEFRAVDGSTTGYNVGTPILKLLANRDVHLYGELVLHDGGVRSFNTMGFTTLDATQDIASFRSGGAEGTEKLRIGNTGDITGVVDHQDEDVGVWTLKARDWDSDNAGIMALECSKLNIEVIGGTVAVSSDGGLTLPDYLTAKVASSIPLNSDPYPIGTMIFEQSLGTRLWIRFEDTGGSGSDHWWYVELTQAT